MKINEYKFMYLEQKNIIEAYSTELYQLKKDITNLKNYRANQDHKFMEYYKFYVQDKKKYDEILKAVDILLQKYDC